MFTADFALDVNFDELEEKTHNEIINSSYKSNIFNEVGGIVNLYTTATLLIGQDMEEGGKVMGLSSYGEKIKDFPKLFIDEYGRTDNSYVIYSGNVILEEKVHELRNKLLEINSMTVEEIKEVYKMIIAGSSGFSEKAGAGLGLIDIAKKSGSKLDFDFEHVNEKYAFF